MKWFDNPDIIYIRPQNSLISLSIIIAIETPLAPIETPLASSTALFMIIKTWDE